MSHLDVDQVKLEYILADAGSDLHGYSGLIGAQGAVESRVDDALGALSGHAFVTLAHGDLLNVPIVEGLEEAVVQQDDWPVGNDRGSMEMAFTPTRVELDDIVLEGDVLGVRGSGEINYDGGINFRFNAGPLERMQMNLGGLWSCLGLVAIDCDPSGHREPWVPSQIRWTLARWARGIGPGTIHPPLDQVSDGGGSSSWVPHKASPPCDEAGGEIIDEDADATMHTLDATDRWRFRDVQNAEEHESCGDDQDQHGAGV